MLSKMVNEKRIKVKVQVKDKHEAIRTAGKLLLEDGYVKESYIDAMIELSDELNSYIVIAPGIAMPHARPEKGALKSGFAILTLKDSIVFGNPTNDPVKLVIALAAVDNQSHLKALRGLSLLLSDEENVSAIMNMDEKQGIIDLIKNFEKKLHQE